MKKPRVWRGMLEVFPPMNTPSPESMGEVMTFIKRCCDISHNLSQAIKNPALGVA